MTNHSQYSDPAGTDDLVEKAVPMSDFAPACIADPGKVRQGGLHRVLPWLIGKIFGDGP